MTYAAIQYIPQCTCPLPGYISAIDPKVPDRIRCITCDEPYEARVVYYNVMVEEEKP